MDDFSKYVYTDLFEMLIKEIRQGIVIIDINTNTTTNRCQL